MPDKNGETLRHYWWPVAFSKELEKDRPLSIHLFGEPLVLFRTSEGIVCLQDRCPHRSTPLSFGYLENSSVVCRYHGWSFGTGGHCTRSTLPTGGGGVRVRAYQALESGMLIWVFPHPTATPKPFVDPWHLFDVLGPDPRYSSTTVLRYEHPWWLWAPSIIDPGHIDFVHAASIPGPGRSRWNCYFHPEVSPALYAVTFNERGSLGRLLIQVYICPTRENENKHFLIYSPTSRVLPRKLMWRLFQLGRFQTTAHTAIDEDYYLIQGQLDRMIMGAADLSIAGSADGEPVQRFNRWYRPYQDDPIWFKSFADGTTLGAYEPPGPGATRRQSSAASREPVSWKVHPSRGVRGFLKKTAVRVSLFARPSRGITSLPDE